jgi:hypothetical protein
LFTNYALRFTIPGFSFTSGVPMFKNFFKLSLRSMARNKVHALINVAGLSLGIVGALVIFLIIRFELNFDTHHRDADRIYRLVRTDNEFGKIRHTPGVPYPLPQALRNDFPEIEHVAIVDANFTPSVFAVTRPGPPKGLGRAGGDGDAVGDRDLIGAGGNRAGAVAILAGIPS